MKKQLTLLTVLSILAMGPVFADMNILDDIPDVTIKKNPAQTKIQIKNDNDSGKIYGDSGKIDMEIKTHDLDNPGKGKAKGRKNKFQFFWR